MIYFGYSPIKGFRFLEQIICKYLVLKSYLLLLFHGLSFDILEKRKKCLAGGSKLSPPPQISRIIQFKNLRIVIFVIYIIPYVLYEEILQSKRKKDKEKKTHNLL